MAAIQGRKGGSSEAKSPVETPDSIRSVARAKLLLALGEGEFDGGLDGRRIFLDDTPLISDNGTENFPGVKWDFRPGTQHQEHIPGLPSVENEITVGVELRSDAPWTRAVSNASLSAVRLRLSWPSLQQQNDRGVFGYRIDYVVEISTAGSGWTQVLAATLNDKTTTKYERSHRIDLPASDSGWSVRVRRLTPNQDSNKIADIMRVEAITEVIDAKLRYPNTALLYIEFDASQFQNIPKVSCLPRMRVIRVPTNYQPATRSYTGIWDGTFKWAWTDNPAWVLYDIILNKRFGMGRRLDATMVDRWELYQIAQYCDELVSDGNGGMEPRFTCNVYIQDSADAWDVLRDIAAIFRGITYWSGREMVAQADMPSDVEYIFSRSNAKVVDGKINYSAQSERTRYTSVLVGYDNPKNRYENEPEPVSITSLIRRYGFNQTQITAIGCISQSEANRRGRWLLLTNSVDRSITFTTGLDGYLPKPGRIIGMADAFLAGRELAGRISMVSGRQITLDRDAVVKVGDRLLVNLPSGKAEARTVQSVIKRTVTVTAAYSETPLAQAQWGIDSTDLVIQQYRVTSISRTEKGFEISGIMTDPGKYSMVDSGTRLEPRPISVLPTRAQEAPASVQLSSYTRVVQGLAVTTLRADWPATKGAIAYTAEWRKDSGEWITVPRTSGLGFEVPGIYAGRYIARVRAVNVMDVASLFSYSEETHLNGKEGLPPAVSFLRTSAKVYGVGIEWGFPPGAEDTQRTEIWNSKVNDLATAVKLADFAYPQATHEMQNVVPGTSLFFWARLVDRTGNVGPWYPAINGVNGQPSVDQSEYEKYFLGKIQASALGAQLFAEIGKISGEGEGSVNERLVQAKKELEELIGEITDAMVYDPAKPYGKGEIVRLDGRLFSAIKAVPAATPPPNADFWYDMGTIAETTNAMALQIQKHSTQIETIDGKVTAQASTMQALQAAWREDDGIGAMNEALKAYQNTASIVQSEKVIAEEKRASATRFTSIEAAVGNNAAGLTTLESAVATEREVTAQRIESVSATANIANTTANGAVGTANGAVGTANGALGAASYATAKAESASTAVVGLNGKVSALTTIKASTSVGGRTVMAGLAIGVDGQEQESQILAFAQRFAIMDEVSGQLIAPFVVQGGQVFMNTAIISTAFIKELVLGMTLRSAAVNAQGLPLLEINIPAGTLTLRSAGTGGSSLLNNDGLAAFDAAGTLRAKFGRLS